MLRLSRGEQVAAMVLLAAGLLGVILIFYRAGGSASARARMTFVEANASSETNTPPHTTSGEKAPSEPVPLVVHVVGAVKKPDVYRLPPGSRVVDAVKAAGGAAEKADLNAINLADKLNDGVQIVIPTREEAALTAAKGTASPAPTAKQTSRSSKQGKSGSSKKKITSPSEGQVNINTAGSEELQRLPGVGPAIAGRTLEYRKANGPFRRIEDIQEVKGIGPKKFAKMKSLIRL